MDCFEWVEGEAVVQNDRKSQFEEVHVWVVEVQNYRKSQFEGDELEAQAVVREENDQVEVQMEVQKEDEQMEAQAVDHEDDVYEEVHEDHEEIHEDHEEALVEVHPTKITLHLPLIQLPSRYWHELQEWLLKFYLVSSDSKSL